MDDNTRMRLALRKIASLAVQTPKDLTYHEIFNRIEWLASKGLGERTFLDKEYGKDFIQPKA